MKRRTAMWLYEIAGLSAAVGAAVGAIDSARELARLSATGCTVGYCTALAYSGACLVPLILPLALWRLAPRDTAWSHLWARATVLPALIWLTARIFLWLGPSLF